MEQTRHIRQIVLLFIWWLKFSLIGRPVMRPDANRKEFLKKHRRGDAFQDVVHEKAGNMPAFKIIFSKNYTIAIS